MKKILFIMTLFTLLVASCKENERMVYEDKAGLYFTNSNGVDSTIFSFTMTKENTYKIDLQINLLGQTSNQDRKFKIVLGDKTTAVEGEHFKKLDDYYLLQKDSTKIIVPIELYKTANLDDNMFVIDLKLVEDDTFSIGYVDKGGFKILTTNRLVKPSYWDMPLSLYFSDYSKVKHQVCIDIMGKDFPLVAQSSEYQYYMRVGRKAALYFAINKVYDENGNLIETWNPF